MTRLVRRCALPLSLAIAAASLVALPAMAAPTWVPAVEVQNGSARPSEPPVVAVDAEGATTIWLSDSVPTTPCCLDHPSAAPGRPRRLPSSAPTREGDEPRLAVDAAGRRRADQDVGAEAVARGRRAVLVAPVPLSDAADSDASSVGLDGRQRERVGR